MTLLAREVAFIASVYLQGMDATATLLQHTASDVLALLSSRYGSLRLVLVESLLLALNNQPACNIETFTLNKNAAKVVVMDFCRHGELDEHFSACIHQWQGGYEDYVKDAKKALAATAS